jgi:hypothetical protein
VFTARYGLYIPPGLTFTNSTFCPHGVFMCFVWISEQTAIISLCSINWLVFMAETDCVYCAVLTGSSNIIHVNPTLEGVKVRRGGTLPLLLCVCVCVCVCVRFKQLLETDSMTVDIFLSDDGNTVF